MKIIDNKKDYYDYLAGIYGIDTYITYDRRNSTRLYNKSNQNQLDVQYPWWPVVFCPYKNGVMPGEEGTLAAYYHKTWDEPKASLAYPGYYAVHVYNVGILIGFKLYVVEVKRLLKDASDTIVKLEAELLCVKDYDRREKHGGIKDIIDPIVIGEVSYSGWYPWKYSLKDRDNNEDKFRNVGFTSSSYDRYKNKDVPDVLVNPIMAGTWIPSVIPAEEVWNNVTDYLLAIKEKPIVDNRTDEEHAESHGFDRKTSFRNM